MKSSKKPCKWCGSTVCFWDTRKAVFRCYDCSMSDKQAAELNTKFEKIIKKHFHVRGKGTI